MQAAKTEASIDVGGMVAGGAGRLRGERAGLERDGGRRRRIPAPPAGYSSGLTRSVASSLSATG